MHDAFMSYKRDSSAVLARLITKDLRSEHNIDVFLDTQDLGSGPFSDSLKHEIEQAPIFLCLLANSTIKSKWVIEEIKHAILHEKTLIPIFHEEFVEPRRKPPLLDNLLKYNGITILDRRGLYFDEAIRKLASLIKPNSIPTTSSSLSTTPAYSIVQIKLDRNKIQIGAFLAFVAGITLIGINSLRMVSQQRGSIILNIEMPDYAARYLIDLSISQPELFFEFRLESMKLVDYSETLINPLMQVEQFEPRTLTAFISHGRDTQTLQLVTDFLRELGVRVILLNDFVLAGDVFIQRLEQAVQLVDFAIIVITPDDEGRLQNYQDDQLVPRTRQNVIFETGYLIAKLGTKKVILLQKGAIEVPSNFHGLQFIAIDDSDYWKLDIQKETENFRGRDLDLFLP